MKLRYIFIFLLILSCINIGYSYETSIIFTTKDTAIRDGIDALKNYGASTAVQIDDIDKALFYFDLSTMPINAVIYNATLGLSFSAVSPDEKYVYQILKSWDEGTKNGGTPNDGANWANRTTTALWTTAGMGASDYSAASVGTTILTGAMECSNYMGINYNRCLDATTAVDNQISSGTNYGLMVKNADGTDQTLRMENTATTNYDPVLKIVWDYPPPTFTLLPNSGINSSSLSNIYNCNATSGDPYGNITSIGIIIGNNNPVTLANKQNGTFITGFTNHTARYTSTISTLTDGKKYWSCIVNQTFNGGSTNNNVISTAKYILVDTSAPKINFVSPTMPTDTANSTLKINITSIDTTLKNITMYIYDSDYNLIYTNTSSSSPFYKELGYLIHGNDYYYNASTYDYYDNYNTTETRKITINKTSIDNLYFYNITTSSMTVNFDYMPDIESVNFSLYNIEGSYITSTLATYPTTTVQLTQLSPNTEYILNWTMDYISNANPMSYSAHVKTFGWYDDLDDLKYRRAIYVYNTLTDEPDTKLTVTLDLNSFWYTDVKYDSESSFSLINGTDGNDFHFTDYRDITILNHTITDFTIYNNGQRTEQLIPDNIMYDGTYTNEEYCHDGSWGTYCSTIDAESIQYFNYTKPTNAVNATLFMATGNTATTGSIYDIYYGTVAYTLNYVPYVCMTGTDLEMKILSTPTNTVMYCKNIDTQNWNLLMNSTSNIFAESRVRWYYDNSITFEIDVTYFNYSQQEYTPGIDGNYDNYIYMYYGNSSTIMTTRNTYNAGTAFPVEADGYNMGVQKVFEFTIPSITSVDDTIDRTSTSTKIRMNVNQATNNTLKLANNSAMIGYTLYTSSSISTSTLFTLSSLNPNIIYYYELTADNGVNSKTYSDNFILDTPYQSPISEIYNYTENRVTNTIIVCGNVISFNGSGNVNASIQYWKDTDTAFSQTSETTLSSPGIFCKSISVDLGGQYNYRVSAKGLYYGYSDVYYNEYMPRMELFAGSTTDDDNDNRHRQYCVPNEDGTVSDVCYEVKGFGSGTYQTYSKIWIETNITNKGSLMVVWWDGDSWNEYAMNDGTTFYYKEITGLNTDWQTFYIKNNTDGIVLNWTRPGLNRADTGTRYDVQKYVSFNNIEEELNYKLLYMDYQPLLTGVTAMDYCKNNGGDIISCMGSTTWGMTSYPEISFLNSSTIGTKYDVGQLFNDGVWNGGQWDTGVLNDNKTTKEVKSNIPFDYIGLKNNSGRYCLSFLDYTWNSSTRPNNNIENYYYHIWSMDQLYSSVSGYASSYVWGSTCLTIYNDDIGKWDNGYCSDSTSLYSQDVVLTIPAAQSNSSYNEKLQIGSKSGFNTDTDISILNDITFTIRASWANQLISKHQPGFIIYNLPDNLLACKNDECGDDPICACSNPGCDSITDTDNDGLKDCEELWFYYTNPQDMDTDSGGVSDYDEVVNGTQPNIYYDDYWNIPLVTIISPLGTEQTDYHLINFTCSVTGTNGVINATLNIWNGSDEVYYNDVKQIYDDQNVTWFVFLNNIPDTYTYQCGVRDNNTRQFSYTDIEYISVMTVPNGETVTVLNPLDDSFIRKQFPTSNYGTLQYISNELTAGFDDKHSIFKFYLSNIGDKFIASAGHLNIYDYSTNLETGEWQYITTYKIDDSYSWNETNITWNTRPSDAKFSSNNSNVNYTRTSVVGIDYIKYTWDIVDLLNMALTGDENYMTIYLKSTEYYGSGSSDAVSFISQEFSTSEVRPYINFSYEFKYYTGAEFIQPNVYNQMFNHTPTISYIVHGDYDDCWYYRNNNPVQYHLFNCINITDTSWVNTNGYNNITLYVDDSAGNLKDKSNISFYVDTVSPNIYTISPEDDSWLNHNNINITYYAYDSLFIYGCWWSNETYTSGIITDCSTINLNLSDGNHNFTVYINDTAGNINSTFLNFTIDSINPTLSIISPSENGSKFTYHPDINYSYYDANMENCLYKLNDDEIQLISGCSNLTNLTFVQGMNSITIYIYDKADNVNISTRTLFVDTAPPDLYIISPSSDGLWFNYNILDIDFYTYDVSNVSHCWYSNNSGVINSTPDATCQNITDIIWSDDAHTVTVYANDTYNNINVSERTFNIDTIYPSLILYNPINEYNYSVAIQNINFSASDANRYGCWYNKGDDNISITDCINLSISFSQGYNTLILYVNDSATNLNTTSAIFFIDSIIPKISIIHPIQNLNYSTVPTILEYSYIEQNTRACWYSNATYTSTPGSCTNFTDMVTVQGSNTWTVYINDTTNNQNSSSVTFWIDTIYPQIEMIIPENNINYSTAPTTLNYIYDENNVKNCWWTNATYTSMSSACNNFTDMVTVQGSNTWTVYINDTSGNINSSSKTFWVDSVSPQIITTYPISYTNYSIAPIEFRYDYDEINARACWYSNATYTSTPGSCTNFTDMITVQGTNTWTIYMNDTANNQNSSTITFWVDDVLPIISTVYPEQSAKYISTQTIFNYTFIESNPRECWWENGTTNTSKQDCANFTSDITSNDGSNTWTVYITDTSGNNGSSSVTFLVDTLPPTINILIPDNNGLIFDSNIYINFTVNDANGIDKCWYSNLTGENSSPQTCQNFTSTWAQGSNTVTIYVNDTFNNINYASRQFNIDTINPLIDITYPEAEYYYNYKPTTINYTYSDNDVNECWYNVNRTNSSRQKCNNIISGIEAVEDNNTWTIYIDDNAGNENSSTHSFIVDMTDPTINMLFPDDAYEINTSTISFNSSITDNYYVKNATLFIYNTTYILEYNVSNIYDETNSFEWFNNSHTLQDGGYWWNVTAYDNSNNDFASETRNFTIDTIPPIITILSPTPDDGSHENDIILYATSNDLHEKNITLVFADNLYVIIYTIQNTSGMNLYYEVPRQEDGLYWYYFIACDSFNNCYSTEPRNVTIDNNMPDLEFDFDEVIRYNRIITGQFNFSDEYLFRWNVSLDGNQIDGDINVDYTSYVYNLSIDPKSLPVGRHNLTVEYADSHTDNEIEDYKIKRGGWFDNSNIEFETKDNKIMIQPINKKYGDSFNYKKETDRYTFEYTPSSKDGKILLKITTDKNAEIIRRPDSPYNVWIVSGNQWIDFVSDDIDMSSLKINHDLNNYDKKTILVEANMKYKNIKTAKFKSIGDLNIMQQSYTFYTINITPIYEEYVFYETPFDTSLEINKTNTPLTTEQINVTMSAYYTNTSIPAPTLYELSDYFNYNNSLISPEIVATVYINYTVDLPEGRIYLSYPQNITTVDITDCSNMTDMFRTLTYCLKDEETFENVTGDINFNIEVLNWRRTRVLETHGFGFRNTTCATICMGPPGTYVYVNSKVSYGNDPYTMRNYFLFDHLINDEEQTIDLYNIYAMSLNESTLELYCTSPYDHCASDVVLTLYDKNLGTKNPDAYIKILRYYPQYHGDVDGGYKIVEVEKSDEQGTTLAKLQLGDVWYKFVVISYPPEKIIANTDIQRVTTVNKLIPTSSQNSTYGNYYDDMKIESSVDCVKSTKTCTFTWLTPDASEINVRFNVYEDRGFSKILLYTEEQTGAGGTMSYYVDNITGKKITAEGWRIK